MNHYEQRQAARKERLERIAAKLQAEGNARYKRAREMAAAIPFGQPILVGHHSEKRDRNYRGRIHNNFGKAFALQKAAEEVAAKAAAVGTGGISSDDPEAVQKLRAELEQVEGAQARMKAVNVAHKRFQKAPESLETSSLPESDKDLVRAYKPAYSWEPHPFAPYQMSNNNANARRIKARIEQLSRRAEVVAAVEASGQESRTTECGGYKVIENVVENRVQLVFPGKPAEVVRSILKRNGFRWSPMAGAWQRMLNAQVVWSVAEPNGHIRQDLEKLCL